MDRTQAYVAVDGTHAVDTSGIDASQLTFAAIGVASVIAGGRWIMGRGKEDAIERAELKKLVPIVSELQMQVAECRAHREGDKLNMARMEGELAEVKARQGERITREHEHE